MTRWREGWLLSGVIQRAEQVFKTCRRQFSRARDVPRRIEPCTVERTPTHSKRWNVWGTRFHPRKLHIRACSHHVRHSAAIGATLSQSKFPERIRGASHVSPGTSPPPESFHTSEKRGAYHEQTSLPSASMPVADCRPLQRAIHADESSAAKPSGKADADHRHHQHHHRLPPAAGEWTQGVGRTGALRTSLARGRESQHHHHLRQRCHDRRQAAARRNLWPAHDPERKRLDGDLLQHAYRVGQLQLQGIGRRAARHREAADRRRCTTR